MASFLHTGLGGELATAVATGNGTTGIIDRIATDVGSGSGQWTVFDDLRSANLRSIQFKYGTQSVASGDGFFTNASASNFYWDAAPGMQVGSSASGPWHTVSANPSGSTGNVNIADTFAGGEVITGGHMFRQIRSIVLKCNSTIKPFYVMLEEYGNSQVALQVSIWETWDATAHTGTNQSPIDWMRVHLNVFFRNTGVAFNVNPNTVICQYVLSLKPESFILWVGGDPANGPYGAVGPNYSDIYVAQNLAPFRTGDTDCLLHAPTCIFGSDRVIKTSSSQTSLPLSLGGGALLRSSAGVLWKTQYMITPKSLPYYWDSERSQLDQNSKIALIDFEVLNSSEPGASSPNAVEIKRGDVRYLKTFWNLPQGSLGRANLVNPDASVTPHICLYATAPSPTSNTGQDSPDMDSAAVTAPGLSSGSFSYANRYQASASFSPYVPNGLLIHNKWFALPLD